MSDGKAQLLLIEDNPADVELVEEALAEAALDYGLSVVRDGRQAIDFIEYLEAEAGYGCPDLVLLDLNLPKVSGEEVLNRMRASRKCRAAKVLVISSSDTPSDKERMMKLGANEYFHKPSSLKQFMELGPRVRALLAVPI
jgi:DNA-binding response OmpR family regulator